MDPNQGNKGPSRAGQAARSAGSAVKKKAMDLGAKGAGKLAGAASGTGEIGARVVEGAINYVRRHKKTRRAIIGLILFNVFGPIIAVFGIILVIIMFGGAVMAWIMQFASIGFTISKAGPVAVPMGSTISYTITATSVNPTIYGRVWDSPPPGTKYVDCPGDKCIYDAQKNEVDWILAHELGGSDLALYIASCVIACVIPPHTWTLHLVVQPKDPTDNFYAVNTAGGITIPLPGASTSASVNGWVAPNKNNCNNGGYTRYMALIGSYFGNQYAVNYGDPNCDFSKNALDDLIKQQDPQFENLWFNIIVPGESGYNPDAWATPIGIQCTLDCTGAWGLYQMGSTAQARYVNGTYTVSAAPFQPPPAGGKNGKFDRGDVNWQLQSSNAINYNKQVLHCSFRYWATAQSSWGKFSC